MAEGCLRLAAAVLVLLPSLMPLACAPEPRHEVAIRGVRVAVEVAGTPDAKRRGLSGRAALDPGHGMLFPYESAGYHSFWMKDMNFDIDIVWIRDGIVVDIREHVPHRVDPPLPVYRPARPADHVLEVPAGFVRDSGWRIGDPVTFLD